MSTTHVQQRPILMSTAMVQAILEGRKTMTRRVVKLKGHDLSSYYPDDELELDRMQDGYSEGIRPVFMINGDYDTAFSVKCPYGQVGDILWVRESFAYLYNQDGDKCGFFYKTEQLSPTQDMEWKPSIHMPKEACRIFLRITDVRVERLREISEEDAIKEGVAYKKYPGGRFYKTYTYDDIFDEMTAKESFETLWQSINGEDSWTANPYVWVVCFERTENPL